VTPELPSIPQLLRLGTASWHRPLDPAGRVLLLAPLLVLPIHLIPGWNPPTSGSPALWLVLLLSVTVGLPFLVLSTTSPLIQHWFSRTGHAHAQDPYFLYRASNLGSALGLLSYPALIEPHLGLHAQADLWRAGYFAFLGLSVLCLLAVGWSRSSGAATTMETAIEKPIIEQSPLTWRRRVRWILLAAVPSTWMLAVTSYFTTVIRPIPLLWVIPLALYLFSFAVVFARRPLVSRYWLNRLFPFYALPLLGMVLLGGGGSLWLLAFLHFGAFFLGALLCHGGLAADRPSAGVDGVRASKHHAGPALLEPAAEARPVQLQLVVQHVEKGRIGRRLHLVPLAVDRDDQLVRHVFVSPERITCQMPLSPQKGKWCCPI